jgi:transposase
MARKSQRKHKKQQALQHIRGPQAEAFRQLTAGISPDQILVCPLDIGKNVHWGAFHTLDGQLLVEPMKLKTDLADFQTFVNCLDEQIATGRFKLVLMGHEPTGVYHETWARNLLTRYQGQLQGQTSPRMAYRFLNPYQVKLNRNQQVLRFRKTDLLDLGSIGDLLSRGFGYQAGMPSHDYLLIREEVRFLKSKAKELRRLENSIRTTFDHLWPGALGNAKRFSLTHPDLPPLQPLVKTRALERERVRVLIQHCPNPYRLRQLGVSGIRDLFRQHLGRGGDKTAAHILQVANSALLPPLDVTEAYADILQRDFSLYLQLETMIEHAQDQLAGLIPRTPARHLLAVAGAGPILLARYLATLGNPDRFLFADQVWSFAGFDPLTAIKLLATKPTSGCPSSTPLSAARVKSKLPFTRLTRSTGSFCTSSNKMNPLTRPTSPITRPTPTNFRPAWLAIWPRKRRPRRPSPTKANAALDPAPKPHPGRKGKLPWLKIGSPSTWSLKLTSRPSKPFAAP